MVSMVLSIIPLADRQDVLSFLIESYWYIKVCRMLQTDYILVTSICGLFLNLLFKCLIMKEKNKGAKTDLKYYST